MSKKDVIVTIDESRVQDIDQLARATQSAGLESTQVLSMLGQITGRIDANKLDQLRKISGVISVDEGQDYQLPPPGSPIQ